LEARGDKKSRKQLKQGLKNIGDKKSRKQLKQGLKNISFSSAFINFPST